MLSPDHRRVLIAIPVLLIGGTEIQTLNLVRSLTDNGYHVTVCCYYDHEASMVAAMEAAGARVDLLDLDRSAGNLHLLRKLKWFFRGAKPNIVHVQYIAPGLIPILAARLARVPTVFATVHQPGRTYGSKPKLLLRTAARLSTAFFCNSLAVERSWFGNAALFDTQRSECRRHWTIYNAVDVEKISALASSVDAQSLRSQLSLGTGPMIGCVGRLRHEKGQAVLLEAMPVVKREFPAVKLLMVGDGPDQTSLKQKAERLGIAANVVWLGRQDSDEVFRLMGLMDMAVVPSHFEGFGLVAAEAMAAGLPVVASKVDGLVEVVEDGVTGLLFPPGDAASLADALLTLLQSREMAIRMGQNGLKRVRLQFSLEKFSDLTLAAYKNCTKLTQL